MNKKIKINKSVETGLKELLISLLESRKIKAVFTLERNKDAVYYSLITDLEKVDQASPFLPFMPANGGKLLSKLTDIKSISEPIAAVIHPCELAAFIELIKKQQGSLDNLLIISSVCPGVMPINNISETNLDEKIKKYFESAKNSNIPTGLRENCEICSRIIPTNADIIINLMDKDIDNSFELYINSEKAEKFLGDENGEILDSDFDFANNTFPQNIKDIISQKEKNRIAVNEKYKFDQLGMDGLIDLFGKCIGCHSCGGVCPICYCELCDFDSAEHEYKKNVLKSDLNSRAGVRLPPNTILYQLGRLNHISTSCVGCGMCTDVCPVDIPVGMIFSSIGNSVQELFKYIPGENLEEANPITVYKKEELTNFED
ncbi:4Fe-4S binding protein [Candidatus Dependentiae bacterium]|nr:4Fe-4S binding protein [Candidatus Dependentiae bacterium]